MEHWWNGEFAAAQLCQKPAILNVNSTPWNGEAARFSLPPKDCNFKHSECSGQLSSAQVSSSLTCGKLYVVEAGDGADTERLSS